jgi:hypothetical protein
LDLKTPLTPSWPLPCRKAWRVRHGWQKQAQYTPDVHGQPTLAATASLVSGSKFTSVDTTLLTALSLPCAAVHITNSSKTAPCTHRPATRQRASLPPLSQLHVHIHLDR